MLIAPGAIAFLLTRRFSDACWSCRVVVAVAGVVRSASICRFFIDSAPAPTIVLLMTVVFVAAFVLVTSRAARLQGREAALAVNSNDPGTGQSRM